MLVPKLIHCMSPQANALAARPTVAACLPVRFFLLALFWFISYVHPIAAADYPVKITGVRIGLPVAGKPNDREDPAVNPNVAKFATWSPVYIDLELHGTVGEAAEITIDSTDPDEIDTTLTVPLNLVGLDAGSRIAAVERGTVGYVRPAGSGEVVLVVRRANGGAALSEPYRVRSLRPRDALTYVVLTLGAPIPGFELPKPLVGATEQLPGIRGGRVEVTSLSAVNQLPDRWFGYEGANVAVLNTAPGSDEFIKRLFGEHASEADKIRREALIEWLRRGGRLLITVGENAEVVAKLPALGQLLPFSVNAAQPVRRPGTIALSWTARESTSLTSTLSGALGLKSGVFPVANLVPRSDRTARVLIPTKDRLKDIKDVLAAQSAYGLGRVTVLGFDLDRPPFTEFTERAEFWDWVLREGGANRASAGSEGKPRPGLSGATEEEDEVAIALRTHLDTFDGIPVVSFGWVAVLIILYILLIGPIEYFFLKRVFGRLELTWITFPIIVLTVSLAAYFTAYSLKGRDLKINKLDVLDVDSASNRVYGTTWFTIFSPRIETYNLAITPGEEWCGEKDPPGTMVSWVGAPRGGRASLLRRGYRYHAGEDGLENVPIQVWSTKSFIANWSGSIDRSLKGEARSSTLVESRLQHPPGDPATVIGTFVNRMPIPVLSDCVVFYAGQAYPLSGGTIRSGETIRLVLDKGVLASQWLQKEGRLEEVLRRVPSYAERPGATRIATPQAASATGATPFDHSFPFWGVFFHEASLTYGEGVIPRNASLRWLDQSWRLDPVNRGEVMLIGRVPPASGPAEETLSGPNAGSRLWLREFPGSESTRTPLAGSGRQETWVRVFIPVR
jgi:hypothetical protein